MSNVIILLGKVARIFFTGDARITDSTTYLKSSVDDYNQALLNINVRITIKLYDWLKGILCIALCS